MFDPQREEFAQARRELRGLLSETEFSAARRSTLNAHYTDVAIAEAMWQAVRRLGFEGGTVLEPGCGAGTFLALAPEHARMVGVEVEPVTAAIAQALHPHAAVRSESFVQTRAPEGTFDLVIGNVPFAKVAPADPVHNGGGHSIHNYFLLKSVRLTRPGGLVVALTSRYTLDSENPSARRELSEHADLVGAVRLPSKAHQRAAGTAVVTDLLVLRRREPEAAPADLDWLGTSPMRIGDDEREIPVNRYFQQHPEMVLGTPLLGHGAYRQDELQVVGDLGDSTVLSGALEQLVQHATAAGLDYTSPTDSDTLDPVVTLATGAEEQQEGLLQTAPDGTFTRIQSGAIVGYAVPRTQQTELRALIGLRDTTRALLDAEAATADDTAEIAELREELGQRYDAYVETFGPIRRFTWRRTGRQNAETGEDILAKQYPPQGGFRTDPYSPVVRALEDYDESTGQASRAAIFTERVVAPRRPRTSAETPAEALAICLDTYGVVNTDHIAALLQTDPADVRDQLGDLVFEEPPRADQSGTVAEPGRLVVAAEYLSGNVRSNLAAAEAAADADPRFQRNVDALRPIIPSDLGPAEIHARLGAPWISADHVQQFLRETLEDPRLRVEHAGGNIWKVQGAGTSVAATSTWGTTRRAAPDLAEAALEQRSVRVYDEDEDGRRWLNTTETLAAQEKMAALDARFGEWVWEDPQRAEHLARVYNERFNAIVLRSYDGSELTLPGIAETFPPLRPHQRAAIARMISEPAVGLFHEVGAGKTVEMIAGAMELKRLGMVRKPAIVVPNHMLDQFAAEFLALYPRANILPAGRDDLSAQRRRDFVARAATGDWDAIILTRSAFTKLPMSVETQTRYEERESARVRAWLEDLKASGERSLNVKRMEGILARAEERLKEKLDKIKDPGLTFEQTGIDWLAIDEAHDFKNLRTLSNIPDAAVPGADRATDLHMKLEYLRERHGGRVGVLATATPIANSVSEAHVMQRYLRPDLLEEAGVEDFDSWAATFGEVVTGIELAPDGGKPRMKSRFAKFKNVPELLRMWHVSADVKTAEDLDLPVPALKADDDGRRAAEAVVVPGSAALENVVADLVRRAEQLRGGGASKGKENMLTITGEGRAAALDLRLVGADTDETVKLDVAADRIAGIWRDHRDTTYLNPDTQQAHPTPGALQLVFCDLGVPNDEGRFSVYDDLRTKLHERGLPEGSVRFMHEANNDAAKAAMFRAARSGQIAVLIGSTQRMGVGTNVQTRARALHHLDCPWRPADIAQREGRIIRQRNQNPEVEILRYVTEGSFDAYSWQTVTRKAMFIAQMMRGRLDVREIEDIGDAALSYDEVKALATGDPRVMEKAKADSDVNRLERLERAHYRNNDHLQRTVRSAERAGEEITDELRQVDAAVARRTTTRGEAFRAEVWGHPYTSRSDAGRALQDLLRPALTRANRYSAPTDARPVVEIGGHTVTAAVRPAGDDIVAELTLVDVPRGTFTIERSQFLDGDPTGLMQRLENKLGGLDKLAETLHEQRRLAAREAEQARAGLDQPFPHADQLAGARATAQMIATQMLEEASQQPSGQESAPAQQAAAGRNDDDRSAAPRTATTEELEAARQDWRHRSSAPSPEAATSTSPPEQQQAAGQSRTARGLRQ
ncbi:SNF2-related protein [Pseudonocardia alni]|uniref:SNF2-related protein n=1 Tax=Pseudonocardia alni TaxID=33907 RepID=UPI000C2B61DE|nr:SNF2-related protein [Pseudonocardia alni]